MAPPRKNQALSHPQRGRRQKVTPVGPRAFWPPAINNPAVTRPPLFGPQALGVLFIVLWSSAWIAGKIGLEFTGPLTLLEIRFTAAALVMLLVALLTGAPWPRRWADYAHLAVAGLLVNGLTLAA